jgi:hypothetical protein
MAGATSTAHEAMLRLRVSNMLISHTLFHHKTSFDVESLLAWHAAAASLAFRCLGVSLTSKTNRI